jgi:ABC-type transport system involved in multi-copper enzyme maturation permease subunit
MGRLIRAEIRKLRTMLQIWIISGGGVLYTVGIVLFILAVVTALPEDADSGLPPLETAEGVRLVISQISGILPFVLVLGVLVITSEYRHQTITSAFLVSPNRARVVSAKFVVAGLAAVVVTVVTAVLFVAVVLPWLAATDVTIDDAGETILLPVVGSIIAGVGYALIGVGLGAWVRNQIGALIGGLLWILLVEPIVALALPDVAKWTPGGAAAALTRAVGAGIGGDIDADAYLPMWAGGLVLFAYAVVITVSATQITVKRDVT